MTRLLVIPLALTLAGCGGDTGTEPLTNEDFADELNVDLNAMTRTSSGLYLQDLVVGTGDEAAAGDSVLVLYEGWLRNGTRFDGRQDRDDPFGFRLGVTSVIAGWHEGVAGMRVGGIRKLVIPPGLAYGPASRPGIPANSTLVFDIELLEVLP